MSVSTHDQLSDALTKPFARQRFLHLQPNIDICNGTPPLQGRIIENISQPQNNS